MDDRPLVISPKLAKEVGLNESIILQQLHYWLVKSNNVRDDYYWVYNTYKEWAKQFPFWSESTVKRILRKLEKEGYIVVSNYNKSPMDKTKWYRIDYDKLGKVEEEMPVFDGKSESDDASGQNDPIVGSDWSDGEVNLSNSTGQIDPSNNHRVTTESTSESTSETTTTTESDMAEIIQFWDSNGFGINNIHAKQSLLLFLDDGSFDEPKEMVLEAMKIACGNGKTFGRFVEGILKRWIDQNIRCVKDISRHSFKNHKSYPPKEEVVPDWFKERQKEKSSEVTTSEEEKIDVQKEKEKMMAFIKEHAKNG